MDLIFYLKCNKTCNINILKEFKIIFSIKKFDNYYL